MIGRAFDGERVPLNDRVMTLVDHLIDDGRKDEARIVYDAMATLRALCAGTPRGMDLASVLQLAGEAAERMQTTAARYRHLP